MRSRTIKVIATVFGVVVIGLLAISLLIKTGFMQQKLIGAIKKAVRNSTGHMLEIGKVDFAVRRGVVVSDIELEINDESFLAIDNIKVGYPLSFYTVLKEVAAKNINILNVEIDGLNLVLSKNIDGQWNYNNLKSASDKGRLAGAKYNSGSNWKISIDNLDIKGSKVSVTDKKSGSVRVVDVKKLSTSFIFETSPAVARVEFLDGLIYLEPGGLIVSNLSSSLLKLSKKEIDIGRLGLDLNSSKVSFSGRFLDSEDKKYSVAASIDNFISDEFILNLDFKGEGNFTSRDDLGGQFSINIDDSKYFENKFSFKANDIKIKDSVLTVNDAVLDSEAGKAGVSLDADLKNIFNKEKNNDFNASLKISGFDYSIISKPSSNPEFDSEGMPTNVDADIKVSGFINSRDSFDIRSDINSFKLKGEGGGAGLYGSLKLSDKSVSVDIEGNTDRLDIGYFTSNHRLKSSINSKIDIDAVFPAEFDIQQLSGSADIKISDSEIFNNKINSGNISAKISPNKVENASIRLLSDFMSIDASGGTRNEKLDFVYNFTSNDLGFISNFINNLDLKGSANLSGSVKGELQNPNIDYDLSLSEVGFKDIRADSGKSSGTIAFGGGKTRIESASKLQRLNYRDRVFESLDISLSTSEGVIMGETLLIEDDDNNCVLAFNLGDINNEKKIEFSKVELNFDGTQFKNDDRLVIDYKDGISIRGLNLSSGESKLTGLLDYSKTDHLRGGVNLINFELIDLSQILDMSEPVSGVVNGKAEMSGSGQAPRLISDIKIDSLKYKDFSSGELRMNLSYAGGKFNINMVSDLDADNKLKLTGVINSDLSFGGDNSSFNVSGFDLKLFSNNLNLSPFSAFSGQVEELNGVVDLDVKINGTPRSPRLLGSVDLENTVFKLKSLRNKITINSGQILLDGAKAKFNNFKLTSGEGTAGINGDLDFSELSYNALGDFDRFRINPRMINTNLTGKLQLNGKEKNIDVGGDVTLNGTRITITQTKKEQVSEIKFVDEREDEKDEIVIKDERRGSYFKDHTALNLNVAIPKNSWVRGRGANVELQGALKIDKKYMDDPLITGNISAVRGTYKIFGKLFKIQEGNVNFPGIKELNPLLDIKALYSVSDIDVIVGIEGDVKNPNIKLSSDPALEETDIISYLVFGSPSDQLGTGQRSALGQAATGLAGGVALNQLRGVLGDDFAPDVLSFGTGTAGPELEIGEYLNDDIYIAYERKSSSDSGTSIPTDTVKVEYRLLDFLSVGSDVGSEQSGGDLFFNFEY